MRTASFATISLLLAALLLYASPASAQECSEEVVIETWAGTIAVHHGESRFNCCAWLEIEVVQEDYFINVLEREMFDAGPCYCLCCFAVDSTISGLAPGEYSVSVWKLYYNFDGTWTEELVGTWSVTVAGTSVPSVESSYVPCVETALPDEPESWGTIKALFR